MLVTAMRLVKRSCRVNKDVHKRICAWCARRPAATHLRLLTVLERITRVFLDTTTALPAPRYTLRSRMDRLDALLRAIDAVVDFVLLVERMLLERRSEPTTPLTDA